MINNKTKKGFLFVLATAGISGFSIFLNKFGVAINDPYIFAGIKNILVGIFFVGIVMLLNKHSLNEISKKQWMLLAIVGLIGGAIPFLMFFKGLSITLAVKAGFIHKSMFLIVAMLSAIFLKNRHNKYVSLGVLSLVIGNALFLNIKPQALNVGDLLVLGAVLLWSIEIILSKRLLVDLSVSVVAGSRMFFGSIFIWLFLIISGKAVLVSSLNMQQWSWVGITAVLLIGYVMTFYSGLKYVSPVEATSVLALGAPITAILTMIFLDGSISGLAILGILFITLGLFVVYKTRMISLRQWVLAKNK